jgi:uncharacterized membrane protein YfcA
MSLPVSAIYAALALFTAFFVAVYAQALRGSRPTAEQTLIGFVTNFFDTLGIGSFATTTAIFKFRSLVPDRLIPGTLNAGHTLPVILQAVIYITAVTVDPLTLVSLISASVVGAWLGANIVSGLSQRKVQIGMGAALLVAAVALLMRQFDVFPAGGSALELRGWKLAVGIVGNLLFGAISTMGIGFYAPCMTMVSLLGMNPIAAFPIMMGSSAFLMPVASAEFVKRKAFSPAAAFGLTAGGLLAVPIAAFAVKSLPLEYLRWLTVIIVLYAAVLMLRSEK